MSPEELFGKEAAKAALVVEQAYRDDPVRSPAHYKAGGMEAIDVIEAFAPGNYHRGNALKYLLRAGKKGATEQDLRKAIWYIEREISVAPPTQPYAEALKPGSVTPCDSLGKPLR